MKALPFISCLYIAGCGSQPQDTAVHLFSGTWVETLVEKPQIFGQLLQESERDGWTAFHRHDYKAAFQAFRAETPSSRIGKLRAASAMYQLYSGWSDMQQFTTQQYVEGWKTKRPESAHEVANSMLSRSKDCPASTKPLAVLLKDATLPLQQQAAVGGANILWYDPCVYRQLADHWAKLQTEAKTQSENDLMRTDTVVLAEDIFSGHALGPLLPTDPDFQKTIQTELTILKNEASQEGIALLDELGVAKHYWQHSLLTASADHMKTDEHGEALRLAQMAQEAGRPLGVENSPFVYSQQAAAQLFQGHTRDALSRFAPISDVYPESLTLLEWMGDLAVLKGLDRQGDSKEN